MNIIKKLVHLFIGIITYPSIVLFSKLRFSGVEQIKQLPPSNVLFVCNHQTYFMDVISMLHIFSAIKCGKKNRLGLPYYLFNSATHVHYVAAEQTMKSSWMSRLFLLAGGLTVKRTWSKSSKELRSGLDPSDTRKIGRALKNSWIITFPQGTTTPYAPARKGTALIIKHHQPVVIPVVISGFYKAFKKTGIGLRKKGTSLMVTFKAPLRINSEASAQEITDQIMDAIEQSKKFMPDVLQPNERNT